MQENKVSLIELGMTFAKIGAFTIGGGYAMIPLIEAEIVKRGWLEEKEFPDIIALAQSAPGVLAVNMAIFTGYKLRGTKGSITAAFCTVLPSFLIILLIAMFMANFQDNPIVIKIFKGIRPVVVSLIAVPMVKMARKNNKTWWAWALSLVTLLLVAFLKISPVWILLCVIVLSGTLTWMKEQKKKQEE